MCFFDDNVLLLNPTSNGTRAHSHNPAFNWGNQKASVPYFFATGIPEQDKQVVRTQMGRISSNTGSCIRFQEISPSGAPNHHLEVRVSGIPECQGIMMGWVDHAGYKVIMEFNSRLANQNSCVHDPKITGLVLHELMHVLGIQHTQKRADRDNHILYHPKCVDPHRRSQYEKRHDLHTHNVPYICNSIMHYTQWHFSTGCPTMTAKSHYCKRAGFGSNQPHFQDWEILRQAHCRE